MLPFDAASVATILAAAGCFAAAWIRRPTALRLALIVVAALLIRLDPARQSSLHAWDEQFHAVVAKNLIAHPWMPTLYERPLVAPDVGMWPEGHVWLHKPPFAMWLMALSMSGLGVSALAMRLPSVLLSTLGVVLTFIVGRRVFNQRIGLLAASFQAVNGLLVALASGRRVAEHVDTALITLIQIGMCAAIAWPPARRRWVGAAIAGAAMGAAFLTKSFPALLIVGVAAVAWFDRRSLASLGARLGILLAAAIAVAAPWTIHAAVHYPVESQASTAYALLHLTTVVEGHGGVWWSYLKMMPEYFGELIYIPAIWFVVKACGRDADQLQRGLLAWFAAPYLIFSLVPTKLPGFVAIGAPALFVIQAAFWFRLRDGFSGAAGIRRAVLGVGLVLLLILPARYLLEKTGSFERRDRWPAAIAGLKSLDQELGSADAVIFNMPHALEAMFYTRFTAYARMPRPDEIAAAQQQARPIVIFVPSGSTVDVPAGWRARLLPER
jgi:4-amino-4-deoxy-L-arabinose transferase